MTRFFRVRQLPSRGDGQAYRPLAHISQGRVPARRSAFWRDAAGAFGARSVPLRSPAKRSIDGRIPNMKRLFLATTALVLLAAMPASAQQRSVKIGFISTFSGPTAVIGNDMRNSFELALDHLGRKMGGLPVDVIYEDDQQRPDVGVQKSQKLV